MSAVSARPSAGLESGRRAAVTLLALGLVACGDAEDPPDRTVSVAVAANFSRAHSELARRFEAATGARVLPSVGSTGQLYAQVRNGAPFEVFLSADDIRPRLLEEEGLAVSGTRFTYAMGRLVLYGPRLDSVRSDGADLTSGDFVNLAIANPRTAPYGQAAESVIARIGIDESARARIVRGENVSQALQFVRSGGAELGFVALSQVLDDPPRSYWLVPEDYHGPLFQEAVLLSHGATNRFARQFLEFLRSEEGVEVIGSFGYAAGPSGS